MPRPLVVRVINFAIRIEAQPCGRANPAARRLHRAVGLNTKRPAPEIRVAVERSRKAQHDPEVAVFVMARAEGIFVVVPANAPFVRHRRKRIRASVAIVVREFRHLVAIRLVERAALPRETEHLVLAGGKKLILHLRRIAVGIGHRPDFTAPSAERELAAGEKLDGADLHRRFLRRLERGDFIKIRFLIRRARERGSDEKSCEDAESFHGKKVRVVA